jgi:hypothetical protein
LDDKIEIFSSFRYRRLMLANLKKFHDFLATEFNHAVNNFERRPITSFWFKNEKNKTRSKFNGCYKIGKKATYSG